MIDPNNGTGVSKRNGLALAIAAGTGFGMTHLLYILVKSEPTRVLAMIESWGPLFGIATLLIYVGDRRFGEMIQANRDGVVAMKELADGVQQIATRDDQRTRELDLTLSLVARNSEEMLSAVGRLAQKVDQLPCQPAKAVAECPGEGKGHD